MYSILYIMSTSFVMPIEDGPLSLLKCLKQLPDPRFHRTQEHRLIDILVIGVCTLLCGGEGFNDMEDFGEAKKDWLKTFLELPNGIPSHDTFNRVFATLNPARSWNVSCNGLKGCAWPRIRRSWPWMARPCVGP